jgi:hypothetical protein
MSRTWTDIANSDIDVNSPLTNSLFTAYRDRDDFGRFIYTCWSFAEVSTASSSYVTLASTRIIVPTACILTQFLDVDIWLRASAGTAYARLAIGTDYSSEVNNTSTTYGDPFKTCSYSSIGPYVSFTAVTVSLQLKASGGTAYAKNDGDGIDLLNHNLRLYY